MTLVLAASAYTARGCAARCWALTFFMSPGDPRMLTTLDATLLPLAKDGLTANSTDTISRMP
jgi:hypothetical protein